MTMIEKKIQGFSTIGTAKGEGGKVVARDLFLGIEGKMYALTVATPSYIDKIREINKRIPEPELQVDENILPVPEEVIVEFSHVCATVNETPYESLLPFLREQVIDDDQTL